MYIEMIEGQILLGLNILVKQTLLENKLTSTCIMTIVYHSLRK